MYICNRLASLTAVGRGMLRVSIKNVLCLDAGCYSFFDTG